MGKNNVKNQSAAVCDTDKKRGAAYTVKRIFIDSCVCYTVLVFLLSLIVSLMDNSMTIFVTDFVWLYPFTLLIGLANAILRYKPLAMWIRVILHAVTIYSGFAVYIVLVKQNDASSVGYLSIPFAVAYALVMLGVLVVTSLISKNERENKSEYKNVYSKVNDK